MKKSKVENQKPKVKGGGFTLIELVVILGVVVLIFSLVVFSFSTTYLSGQMETTVSEIVQALHQARVQSISGVSVDGSNPSNFGVYFESDQLTIFAGSTYQPGAVDNETRVFPGSLTLDQIDLPDQSVVFARVTGEVANYQVDQNSLVVFDSQAGVSKTLVINRVGMVVVQ